MAAKEDVTRLPLWAQDMILRLQQRADYYKKQNEQMDAGLSDTYYYPHGWGESGIALPKGVTVEYHLPNKIERFKRVQARVDDHGQLYIYHPGSGALKVRPNSSNTLSINTEDL